MRISLDVSAVPDRPAGAGRYVVEIAQRLSRGDEEVTLVTRRHDAERWKEGSPQATIDSPVPDSRASRLVYERYLLGRTSPATSADVWHAPHYTMPHALKTPAVVTIHDLTYFTNPEWHEKKKRAFFRRAIRYAAHHADALIAVSHFTANLLSDLSPSDTPVIVAPHGVDLEHFDLDGSRDTVLLASFGRATPCPFVLFVGTLEPRKGLDVLLEAFALVAYDNPELELWIAGQAGWGGAGDNVLANRPWASRVRLLGYVSDEVLPALYRAAVVVAYPSRSEGFGLPVLEALACGAVTITTSGTVMEEVAGGAASLVPVGDVEALAAAITDSLTLSHSDRQQRARRGRARAEEFSWDVSLQRHLDAYHAAISRAH